MNILITGSDGFIGRNLVHHLKNTSDANLFCYDKGNIRAELERWASEADFVYHLAGVNRPLNESEFQEGNGDFTVMLLSLLKAGKKPPVVLSSSIQAALDNPYGKSKKFAEEAVFSYGKDTATSVYVYRLPNVFGKWCRPNYNSVVATFCHNTANGLPIEISDSEKVLTLAYIDDVCYTFTQIINSSVQKFKDGYAVFDCVYKITLGALAAAIQGFATNRQKLVLPDVEDGLIKKLYSTWLSYLPKNAFDYPLDMKRDNRGWFCEWLKSDKAGQVAVSRTKPGVTRGNHWHHTKTEKFLVVEGEAVISLRKIGETGVIEYRVSGDSLRVVDIPPGYTHKITNIGETDVITLFWANECFDPDNPDTIGEDV